MLFHSKLRNYFHWSFFIVNYNDFLIKYNKFSWWKNDEFNIGRLTVKTRKIKIINMLTDHEDVIEVSYLTIF